MCSSFGNVDVEDITTSIHSKFSLSMDGNLILLLQNNIMFKAHSSGPKNHFWNLTDDEKYPNFKKVVFNFI